MDKSCHNELMTGQVVPLSNPLLLHWTTRATSIGQLGTLALDNPGRPKWHELSKMVKARVVQSDSYNLWHELSIEKGKIC